MKQQYEEMIKLVKENSTLLNLRESGTPAKILEGVLADKTKEEIAKEVGYDKERVEKRVKKFVRVINKRKLEQKPIQQPTVNQKVVEENLSDLIPKENGYVPRRIAKGYTDIKALEELYSKRMNTLIIGETGCGKTHAVRNVAYKLKVPYKNVNLNGGTTPEDLIGQFVPDNGSIRWQDGILTRFIRHGGIFVCDEINAAPASVLFILHSVLDDQRQIVLTQHEGETIKVHPDFWFVGTMNPDYEGTNPLNQALRDRFGMTLVFEYDRKVEEKLGISENLLNLAEKIRKMHKQGEIMTPVGTRVLLNFMEIEKNFGQDVAVMNLLNRFDQSEVAAISEVLTLELNIEKKTEEIENGQQQQQ